MTLSKKDWKRLQWSIALFVILAGAGAAIVSISTQAMHMADKTNKIAKQDKDAAHGKATRAKEEAHELSEKIAIYQALQDRGIVGQEHRLEWIEQIRSIKKRRKLVDVNYELEPQKLLDAKVVSPSVNGFDILSSPMKLKMALLHENDLLDFLADLRSGIQGYIRVGGCDITRNATAATGGGPAAQLRAECDLDWITIREKQ